MASSVETSTSTQHPSHHNTRERPLPQPLHSTLSSSTDLPTPLLFSEQQEAVSNPARSNDPLEHENQIEIEPTDGLRDGNSGITPTETLSLHIPILDRLPNPHLMVQDGLEWVQELFGLKPTWSLEPSIEAVADAATTALRWQNLISTKSLSHNPFLEFQGAFNKLYSITSNDASYLMRVSLPVDPTFKTWSEASTIAFL